MRLALLLFYFPTIQCSLAKYLESLLSVLQHIGIIIFLEISEKVRMSRDYSDIKGEIQDALRWHPREHRID